MPGKFKERQEECHYCDSLWIQNVILREQTNRPQRNLSSFQFPSSIPSSMRTLCPLAWAPSGPPSLHHWCVLTTSPITWGSLRASPNQEESLAHVGHSEMDSGTICHTTLNGSTLEWQVESGQSHRSAQSSAHLPHGQQGREDTDPGARVNGAPRTVQVGPAWEPLRGQKWESWFPQHLQTLSPALPTSVPPTCAISLCSQLSNPEVTWLSPPFPAPMLGLFFSH